MRTIHQPSQQVSIATTTNNNTALQRPQQPKIPPTAFQLYCNDFISSSTQLQTFNTHSVTHQLKVQWNSMSDVVKTPYINYRKILQKQYEEALKQYKLYNMQNQMNNNMQKQRIQVFGSNINATLQQKMQNAKGRGLGLSLLSINSINEKQFIISPHNNDMVDLTVNIENEQQILSTKSIMEQQKAQGEEKKDQNDYENRGSEKKDNDAIQQPSTTCQVQQQALNVNNAIQQPSTSYQVQQQAPKVKNYVSQRVQNDSIDTPIRSKRKRDDEPNTDDTAVHPEKDFQKWLSTRKGQWVHKRRMKQKNRIQTKADRDMANSKARDKTDEVSPIKKQPLRSKFAIGCPVWFNLHYSTPCSNHLIADSGIVKSVTFNNKTQQLEHEVVSNIDSSVLTLTTEDLAFAVHCPVLIIKTDEKHLDGEIISIKPTELTVNKAVTATYTVMTSNGGRCKIEEGVTDDRIWYKLSLPSLQSKIKDIVPSRKSKFGIRTGSDGRPTLNKAPLALRFKDRSQKMSSTNIDDTSDDQDNSYSSNDEEEQERERRSSTDDDSIDVQKKKLATSASSSSLPKTKKRKKLEKTRRDAVGHDTRDSVKEVDQGKCNSSKRRSRSAMEGSTCKDDPLTYVGNYIANRLTADERWTDRVEKIDLINFGQVIYKPGYMKKTSKEGVTRFSGYAALAKYAYRAGIYKEKVVGTIHGREILAKLGIIDDPYSIFSDNLSHDDQQDDSLQEEDNNEDQTEDRAKSPEIQDDDISNTTSFDLDKYLATGVG